MCALEPNTRAVQSFLITQLGQRRRDMAVDGPHRQHQSICELSVGQTLAEQLQLPPDRFLEVGRVRAGGGRSCRHTVCGVIEVVGLSARGWSEVPDRLRILIQQAEVLLGSQRHLDLIPPFPAQQRLAWPSPLREGLPMLLNEVSGRRVVALASGDPLIAGIGSTLIEMLGAAEVADPPCRVLGGAGPCADGLVGGVNPAGAAPR